MSDNNLLSQEQIARLREAWQVAQEAERLAWRRRLLRELRARRYEGRWIKPFDLWSRGAQILSAGILITTAILTAAAVQAWWLAQQFEARMQPGSNETTQQ